MVKHIVGEMRSEENRDTTSNLGAKDMIAGIDSINNADIRLVVADMDGTLLDSHSEVPHEFWTLLEDMHEENIHFVPASGRQLATLQRMFEQHDVHSYIAENGNIVMANDDIISVTTVDNGILHKVIDLVDAAVQALTHSIGLVVCGEKSAYISRKDESFVAECAKYYTQLEQVDSLHEVQDRILKLAIYDDNCAQKSYDDLFQSFSNSYEVVLSGSHWIDIMNPSSDKRVGVEALQKFWNVKSSQTVAFGDYLNDLGMMSVADWSFAMDNGHEDVKNAAQFIAPSNADKGVLQVIEKYIISSKKNRKLAKKL